MGIQGEIAQNEGYLMTTFRSKGRGRSRKVYPIKHTGSKVASRRSGINVWGKYPSREQVKQYLENNVLFFGVQRLEGNLSIDDFQWHKFKTLKEADDYIREMSRTAPSSGKGYDKAHVDIQFKDHEQKGMRIDLNSDNIRKIEDMIYQSDKYYAEHTDLARKFNHVPYVKFREKRGGY